MVIALVTIELLTMWGRLQAWLTELRNIAALHNLVALTLSCRGEMAIAEIPERVRVSADLRKLCKVVQRGIFIVGLSSTQVTSLRSIWESYDAVVHLVCTWHCVYFPDWCSALCMCVTALVAALESQQYIHIASMYLAKYVRKTICIAICTLHCLLCQLLTFVKTFPAQLPQISLFTTDSFSCSNLAAPLIASALNQPRPRNDQPCAVQSACQQCSSRLQQTHA